MGSLTTTPTLKPVVVLREESMQLHGSGSITGVVFWKVNGHGFPDTDWNDFVPVVLGWWAKAIVQLLGGSTSTEMMDFMDGPYSVLCNGMGNAVECEFVDRHGEQRVVESWSGETCELGREIVRAGNAVLRWCHEHDWANVDVASLEKEVNALRKLI